MSEKNFQDKCQLLLYIGLALGLIPASNLRNSNQSYNFRFSFLSLSFLYTVLLNILVFVPTTICTIQSMQFLLKKNTNGRITDTLSLIAIIGFSAVTKFAICCVTVTKITEILDIISSIGKYDQAYQKVQETKLTSGITIWTIYVTGIIGAIGAFYFDLDISHHFHRDLLITSKCVLSNLIGTNILIGILQLIMSLNVTLSLLLCIFCINAVRDRITNLSSDFNLLTNLMEKHYSSWSKQNEIIGFNTEGKNNITDNLEIIRSAPLSPTDELSRLIARIGNLIEVRELSSKALNPIVFTFTSGGIVIVILFLYLSLIIMKESADLPTLEIITALLPIFSVGVIALLRLFILAESGQQLQNSVDALALNVRMYDATKLNKEISEKIIYLQHITSQINFEFSGSGYYTLNREFISSLVGPVITFVVVLAQFRISDEAPTTTKP